MKKVILSFADGDIKKCFNVSASSVEEDLEEKVLRVYGLRNEIIGMFKTNIVLALTVTEVENVKE